VSDINQNDSFQDDKRYYAGFGRRIIAGIIDAVIVTLIAGFAAYYLGLTEGWRMLLMMLRHEEVRTMDGVLVTSALPGQVATFLLVTCIIIPWLYFAILESSKNQATLGKMAARAIVTDLHGDRITFARASLRHFSKVISILLFFSGIFAIAYTRHAQGLHDIIAACLVYYRPEKIE
jgi:uncharacterized RDD family membrane protein YckC